MASNNEDCPVCTGQADFGAFTVVQFKGLGFFLHSAGVPDVQINFCPECGVMLRPEQEMPPYSVTTQQYTADLDEQLKVCEEQSIKKGREEGRQSIMTELSEFLAKKRNKQEEDL